MLVVDTEFSLLGRIVFSARLVEMQELLHFSVGFIILEKRDRDGGGLMLLKKRHRDNVMTRVYSS